MFLWFFSLDYSSVLALIHIFLLFDIFILRSTYHSNMDAWIVESTLNKIRNHPSKAKVIRLFELYKNDKSLDTAKVWEHYARFVALKIFSGDFQTYKLSPSAMIDSMWHLHILDTRSYSEFCKDIFPPIGPLIHHDPFGQYSSDEEKSVRRNQTKIIYQYVFKERCPFFEEEDQYNTCLQMEPCRCQKDVGINGFGKIINIMIVGSDGLKLRIKCNENILVGRLKRKLANIPQLGVPIFQQRLIFDCQRLHEDKTLKEYQVKNNSILELYMEQTGC